MLDWPHGDGLRCPDLPTACDALMELFQHHGLGVDRLNLGIFIRHPEFGGLVYQRTSQTNDLFSLEVRNEDLQLPIYLKSPVCWCVTHVAARVWNLGEPCDPDFEFFDELRSSGHTGYAVFPLRGTHGRVHVLSVATKKDGGFSPEVWALLHEFSRQLALLIDALTVYRLAEVMLGLYVGQQTGSRVLNGEVYRGVGDIIEAVVLVCDMKGYTQLCSERPAKETIALLNQFFERICEPIEAAGGEVLKFMGDAVLAIFTPGVSPLPSTCRKALRAAKSAHSGLSSSPLILPSGESVAVSAGFALHVGQFHYGNIGASNRLDFTAIGSAVNLASRIEAQTRTLKHDILCTQRFADLAGVSGVHLGRQPLKGLASPVELIGLMPTK